LRRNYKNYLLRILLEIKCLSDHMNPNASLAEKLTYLSPRIERVELDNEISLTLDSTPAPGPGEPGYIGSLAPEYFNNSNPFKSNIG
jgi:hypothetical protein